MPRQRGHVSYAYVSLAEHASRYSWIILADNDILALRNWDHLFENQKADLLVSRHPDGSPDTGIFAIRSSQDERFLHPNFHELIGRDCFFARKFCRESDLETYQLHR